MEKSVFTPQYDVLRKALVRLRGVAGLTQRQLAQRMKRPRSFISRIEQGERRVDLVEFWWICQVCGASFEKTILDFAREWKKIDAMDKH